MVLGIAAIKSVSMIDTLYIGQLGKDQLAALSFAFPVTTIILGLALGLSAGASSVISRALGEGQVRSSPAIGAAYAASGNRAHHIGLWSRRSGHRPLV